MMIQFCLKKLNRSFRLVDKYLIEHNCESGQHIIGLIKKLTEAVNLLTYKYNAKFGYFFDPTMLYFLILNI